ncbi:DUF4123 domain-containing protein [Rodentibacter caecimuris]|uniref:DUF4123 domain-containing protein n=1 Tax=Rodentibacter caecimuris TaxID=1796644 RepID=A0ABX3L1K0_9PAST|nr:hypothetical protein BKG89_00830 [Rodentibacter heylii]
MTTEIWLTHYHLTPSLQNSVHNTPLPKTAYLLAWAKSRDDYEQQIHHYFLQENLNGQAQLAALPIQTWFSRHGFNARLWWAAQQISSQSPIFFLPDGVDNQGKGLPSEKNYLQQHSTPITPFTEFIVPTALPNEIRTDFFANFQGLDEYHLHLNQSAHRAENYPENRPHFYALVDCTKAVAFPSRLFRAGRAENLYIGKTGQALEDHAPHLLEFDPYSSETVSLLQCLFRKADSKVFSYWQSNPVTFIRSDKPFDEVYHHLRKWTHLYDKEEDDWYFFRFYDPTVLNRYLPQLSRYPAQLAAFFGVKNDNAPQQEQIIDAIGVRIEETFITFSLKPLPENIVPAKIEMGKIEKEVFQRLKWERTKEKVIYLAIEHFSDIDRADLDKWLEEAKSHNIAQSQREYWFYLVGRLIAENNEFDYFDLLEQWQQKTQYSNTNLLETLMNRLIEIEDRNHDKENPNSPEA